MLPGASSGKRQHSDQEGGGRNKVGLGIPGGDYSGGHEVSRWQRMRYCKGSRFHQENPGLRKALRNRFRKETDKDRSPERIRRPDSSADFHSCPVRFHPLLEDEIVFQPLGGKLVCQTTESGGGNAHETREAAGETSKAFESQVKADIRHPVGGVQKKLLGLRDPEGRQVCSRRDPDRAPEDADEMPGSDPCFLRQFLNGRGFREEFAHGADRFFCPSFQEDRLALLVGCGKKVEHFQGFFPRHFFPDDDGDGPGSMVRSRHVLLPCGHEGPVLGF